MRWKPAFDPSGYSRLRTRVLLIFSVVVAFDHLVVHTGDIGGPVSLHPELPMRSAELLVRREFYERGLLLMISRKLVYREATASGVYYSAGEFSERFHREPNKPVSRCAPSESWLGCGKV